MTDSAPLTKSIEREVAGVVLGGDATVPLGEAPFAATVTAAAYIPSATITGAATNNRTVSIVNRGQDGTGSTVVATLSFGSGTNANAEDETQLTLSGTAANLQLAAGDVLAFQSTHVGTGIADPGGVAKVAFSRN